jgi:hypothetical protein
MQLGQDFMEAILLVVDTQLTNQWNGFQAMHERDSQNVVVLHLV